VTNQQKESDERLTSRRTCERCKLRACDYQNWVRNNDDNERQWTTKKRLWTPNE